MSKTILVTGGSRGIGFAIAKYFLLKGHHVTLLSRSNNVFEAITKLETIDLKTRLNEDKVKDKESISLNAMAFQCDVTKIEQVNDVVKEISKKYHIECLINSAGIAVNAPLAAMRDTSIQEVINTNLLGTINTCKIVSKIFLKKGQGNIINLSSVLGFQGNQGQAIYSATKAGVIGLTRSLAKELAPKNIRVNCLAPGFIKTDMTEGLSQELKDKYINKIPIGRFGEPEEIAQAAYFLNQATYINGSVLTIDGGLSC